MNQCQICGRETFLIQCTRCQRYTCEFCITLISQRGWDRRQECLFCGARFKEFFRNQSREKIKCLNLACKACYPPKELYKICLIGSPSELKNNWVRRFAEGKFTTSYLPTQGVDILTKQIQVDGNSIKLILVDITSQDSFRKSLASYYRGSSAAVITFDKSNSDSFNAVKDWYKEIKSIHLSIPIALVGFITKKVNTPTFLKIQRDRSLPPTKEELYEELITDEQSLAEELGFSYYETRPNDTKITEQIFHDLILKTLGRKGVC
jgi:GTPase SAR1 family protein